MFGGIIIAGLCVLALVGAGELLIRAVEGSIGVPVAEPHPWRRWVADPMQGAHGDVSRQSDDELAPLRNRGAL